MPAYYLDSSNQNSGTLPSARISGNYTGISQVGTLNSVLATNTITANTLNATSQILLNGTNINTAGTLTNIAYLNRANTFVPTQSITNGLIVDSSTLYVNAGLNRVGIGSVLPSVNLHIVGQYRVDSTTNDGTNANVVNQYGTGRALFIARDTVGTRPIVSFSQGNASGGTQSVLAIRQSAPTSIALGVNTDGSTSAYNTVILGNGSIGLGTTTPAYSFETTGTANIQKELFISGKVGVGTITPYSKLTVVGASGDYLPFSIQTLDAVSTGLRFKSSTVQSNEGYKAGILFERKADGAIGTLHLCNDTNPDAGNVVLGDAKLSIDYNGMVGIGTSTPINRLQVIGTANISSGLIVNTSQIYAKASNGYVGIGTTTPVQKLDVVGTVNASVSYVAPKSMLTKDGGFAIKLTNKTGVTSVKGYVVETSPTTNNAVSFPAINVPDAIGVFYESGIADGQEAWIVVSGIADVYYTGSTTRNYLARTFITGDTGYVAGQAYNEPLPTSPFATDKHFAEIGHLLESRTGAGLAKTVIHFN